MIRDHPVQRAVFRQEMAERRGVKTGIWSPLKKTRAIRVIQ